MSNEFNVYDFITFCDECDLVLESVISNIKKVDNGKLWKNYKNAFDTLIGNLYSEEELSLKHALEKHSDKDTADSKDDGVNIISYFDSKRELYRTLISLIKSNSNDVYYGLMAYFNEIKLEIDTRKRIGYVRENDSDVPTTKVRIIIGVIRNEYSPRYVDKLFIRTVYPIM